jgi:hypothetical protein
VVEDLAEVDVEVVDRRVVGEGVTVGVVVDEEDLLVAGMYILFYIIVDVFVTSKRETQY